MAAPTCKECGTELASRVKSCPHCGAPSPGVTPQRALVWLVAFFTAGGLVAGVASCWPDIAEAASSAWRLHVVTSLFGAGVWGSQGALAPPASETNRRANPLPSSTTQPAIENCSGR
ncbi:zinc ribbon domain-containing protein [Ralstonia solanacearum]|nr:zinc ribbon domain-containing protein [Ralstonia solanacearum]QKL76435.1 zinc ribbon domain-containing protein [Ralstonia solanacearum]QKL81640.1 zinc ribbon domain-containing protein [Ralstonia solanacearum]QKL86850.1 zinc ribbon domain-containing protein [Ralstonia solanacearum]QKM02217.1 zinc ribbon domain-containing protein [Ralstonia solanacearum]